MDEVGEKLWGGEKYALGPMVRACSLPLRLACLEYGADTVYSEEIPAYRAVTCRRYENPVLKTVDFVRGKGNSMEVLFRTHISIEKEPKTCVLQLGTADAVSALKAAKLFEGDVAAIDINMGCPKHYSVSLGKGSELMLRPEVAEDIVKTLRRNCSVPISVKTRLFPSTESTISSSGCCSSSNIDSIDVNKSMEWVRRLQSAGAQAVCVHFRTASEKNNTPAHQSLYPLIKDTLQGSGTHFIYNGDIWSREDIDYLLNSNSNRGGCGSGANSGCFMLSRAALWDPSVFSTFRSCGHPAGQPPQPSAVPLMTLLARILTLSAETANCPLNTRYLMQQILAGRRQLHGEVRKRLLSVFTLEGLSTAAIADCETAVMAERQRQEMAQCNLSEELASLSAEEEQQLTLLGTVPPQDRKAAKIRLRELKFSRVRNCPSWPGIVSLTSHQYNDSYFDDNYYISFRRATRQQQQQLPQSIESGVESSNSNGSQSDRSELKKRPFVFAHFTTTTTAIARVRKASSTTDVADDGGECTAE